MGTLIVIRHAKTEPSAATDYVRELTERGRRDAVAAGRWLTEQGVQADHALVSSARRARQTWVRVAEAAGWGLTPDIEAGLYGADVDEVIDRVRLVPDAETLVVVGHNPTMHAFAVTVDDGEGDVDAVRRLGEGYPTSTVAVYDVPVPWLDVAPGAGRLRALHTARG